MSVDLSHIYCIFDQDEAQRRHGELPDELRVFMCLQSFGHSRTQAAQHVLFTCTNYLTRCLRVRFCLVK
jgi:hypothetical protein